MSDIGEQDIRRAIATLSQADPIVKLLQQVSLGRMKPTDAGLRAITESWLDAYLLVLKGATGFDRAGLTRLDPGPRVAVLIGAGVLSDEHPAVISLRAAFVQALAGAK